MTRQICSLSAASLFVAMMGIAGCGGDNNSPTAPSSTTPTVSAITIDGYTGEISKLNSTTQLKATAQMSNGAKQDITNTVQWASDASGVATVTSAGVLKAVSPGDATITATQGGTMGRQRVTITRPREVQPSIRAGLDVTSSPERVFLYRATMDADFIETGGGVGYSVNFINIVWRDYADQVIGNQHINPARLGEIWGSNYVPAGGGQGIRAWVDYNRTLSRVSAEVTISISDDFGNQRTFSQTFRDSVGITAPAGLTKDATPAAHTSEVFGRSK